MQRFNCYHRDVYHRPFWNGSVYAVTPREALAKFKAVTSTAPQHYVVAASAEGERR